LHRSPPIPSPPSPPGVVGEPPKAPPCGDLLEESRIHLHVFRPLHAQILFIRHSLLALLIIYCQLRIYMLLVAVCLSCTLARSRPRQSPPNTTAWKTWTNPPYLGSESTIHYSSSSTSIAQTHKAHTHTHTHTHTRNGAHPKLMWLTHKCTLLFLQMPTRTSFSNNKLARPTVTRGPSHHLRRAVA
jgi:hypothetical protein